jgi:hypothetical protein
LNNDIYNSCFVPALNDYIVGCKVNNNRVYSRFICVKNIEIKELQKMKDIKTLTTEELKKVFENNSKLKEAVFENARGDVDFWIGEYMKNFSPTSIDYNIGYPGNYFVVKNEYDFIQGCIEIQKDFCFFSDETAAKIAYCDSLMDRYENIKWYDYKNSELLEKRISELVNTIKNTFLLNLINEYDFYYDDKNLLDYFINEYSDNFLYGDYYIDDNYILFQHIEYEKCYK